MNTMFPRLSVLKINSYITVENYGGRGEFSPASVSEVMQPM